MSCRTILVRYALFLTGLLAAVSATAQTPIKFAMDWKYEGPATPYVVAIDKGYYKAEGLDVTIDTGTGSLEGINRIASGNYQFAFADINSLVKFRDNKANMPIKAVMMVYDAPAFAIVALKKSGIKGPKDLEGKILGAPAPDGAYAQWPIFVKENGIDASKVKIENIGFPVREPMLAQGKVDAITGFSFSSYMNLKANGVKPEDIVVLLMRNYGLNLYGNAIMVNPDFAKANPKAVAGFVRATIRGIQETIRDPNGSIKSMMRRNEIADEAVELERLKMALDQNFVTKEVLANGLGAVDNARLAKSIDEIGVAFTFTNKPTAADIFTAEYLPPAAQRKAR